MNFNERNETYLFMKIYLSHFILERGTQFVVSLRDIWRDIYSEKGLLLAPYLLPGARGCQRLHSLASRIVRDNTNASDRLRIPSVTLDSDWTDCLNGSHITWSPSGNTPTQPVYLDALPSPCSLITMWQLVKPGTNPKSMSTVII